MKNFYEVKNISDSVKDVSENTRKVKVAISHMGDVDLDRDMIEASAYDKTIRERGPGGANLIWHLTDHNASLKSAVGKFSELYVENSYLVGITDIPKTSWGNDMMEFYLNGHINQHSIGFRTIKSEPVGAGKPNEYNLIKEIFLYEGSAVLWGANMNTPTQSAGKSVDKIEASVQFEELTKEWGLLMKSLRSGRFTDDSFELIEIRVNQNQEKQKELFKILSTQPEQDSVEPVRDWSRLTKLIN